MKSDLTLIIKIKKKYEQKRRKIRYILNISNNTLKLKK